MTTVKVQAGQSILETYVRKPSTGIAELVWNAFDEDANLVTITCEYSALGGLDQIVVADDGNGMNIERAESSFSRVGDSWKLMPGTKSPGGERPVHGRLGRGRYAAYSLGNVVQWVSTAEKIESDGLGTVRIRGRRTALASFDIEDGPTEAATAGTTVTISQVSPEAIAAFNEPQALRQSLLATFALHLDRFKDFKISFLGADIDPSTVEESRTVIDLSDSERWTGEATLTVIEWGLLDVRRTIFLCDSDDRVIDEVEARIQAPGSEFTAYLKWDGFAANDPVALEDDTETPRGRLIAAARDALRVYLVERARLREAATVQRWLDEGVWPYKDKASSPIEAATVDTFKVIALAASRTVDESKTN